MFPGFGPSGPNAGCLQFQAIGTNPAGTCDPDAGYLPGGYSATQVAYDYMIGYHGTPANGVGFGTSTFWQDVDFFAFPANTRLGPYTFFPAQFVALNTWDTIGRSEYHALQLSARKQMSHGVSFAVNYSLSKSLDHSSTPERQEPTGGFFTGGYTGSAINAWEPDLEYSYSDFDMRHQVNAYFTWELPFGKGKRWGSDTPGFVNAIIGDWQISGIMRFNSGIPANVINGRSWPTNWNLQGNATCAGFNDNNPGFDLTTGRCPKTQTGHFVPVPDGDGATSPNIFPDPENALKFFRWSAMGERGQRNVLRGDGYGSVDMGFAKSFHMPYAESHRLGFRWDIFNLTNTAHFDTGSLNMSISDVSTFGTYSKMLGGPRRMQLSLRYEF
jgi:hypothetical protein